MTDVDVGVRGIKRLLGTTSAQVVMSEKIVAVIKIIRRKIFRYSAVTV